MKAMEHPSWFMGGDTRMGFIAGAVCAVLKLLDIYLLADAYMIVVFKVLITAVAGGFGGVLGKQIFSYLKKKYDQRFKNKNNH